MTLSPEESTHAIRVMRLKQGDKIQIQDGKGTLATALITNENKKACILNVIDKIFEEKRSTTTLTIAIAATKNLSRLEWFVEKATEMGIDKIIPLLCARNERKVLKLDRLQKIAVSAMKQSGQLHLPHLNELTPFKNFVSDNPNGLIAHCETEQKTPSLTEAIKQQENLTILIGPEGDFTPEEVKFALENNYQPVTLGKSILRTETAGVFACAIANS